MQRMPIWMFFLFGAMLVTVTFSSMVDIFGTIKSNFYYHRTISMKLEKSVYKVGDHLTVIFEVDRNLPSNCNSTARRFILNDEDLVVWSQIVPSIARNGIHAYTRTVNIPHDIPPGNYRYRVEIVNVCNMGVYRDEAQDFPFKMVNE